MHFIPALPFDCFYKVYASAVVPDLMVYITRFFSSLELQRPFIKEMCLLSASLYVLECFIESEKIIIYTIVDMLKMLLYCARWRWFSYCDTRNTCLILVKKGGGMGFSSSDCYPQHTTGSLFLCSCLMFWVVNAFPSGLLSMSSLPQIAFCSSSCVVSLREFDWPLSKLDSKVFTIYILFLP